MKPSLALFSFVFIAIYLILAILKKHKAPVAWAGALLLLLLSKTPLKDIPSAINWNVIGIFVGMIPLAEFFSTSGVPAHLAVSLADRAKSTGTAVVFLSALSGFISIFVENVATVLILAPVAIEMAKKLKIPLTPIMVAVAISSNLQGTATLVGDPPSMILAAFLKMNFLDFFIYRGRASIFFAVEAGAILSLATLFLLFRRYRNKPPLIKPEPVKTYFPTWMLIITVLLLSIASFIDPDFKFGAGVITASAGLIISIWAIKKKETTFKKLVLEIMDWDTLFFLMAIFVIVHSSIKIGLIDAIAKFIHTSFKGNVFLTYTALVWGSVLASAFVDNVPYVSAMLPVTKELALLYGNPNYTYLFAFGVLIGACLGGNITPIGAAANVTAMGIARRQGENPGFWDFFKIGFPFTISATIGGFAVTYLVWGI